MADQTLLTSPETTEKVEPPKVKALEEVSTVEPPKQEETFTPVTDLSAYRRVQTNPDARAISDSLPGEIQTNVKLKDFEKYTGQGINPYTQDIERLRAEKQGNWEQFRNFAAQAVGGEIVGGFIEGAGYLAELLNYDNAIWGTKDTFSNALSELGTSMKEGIREALPIYEEQPGTFNMGDFGWWMANGTSVVSFIPIAYGSGWATKGLGVLGKSIAKGVTKGVSTSTKLSRASKLTKETKAFAKMLEEMPMIKESAKTFTHALLSRHIESSMEAVQFFDEKYKEGLERGFTESQAREYASMGAESIYKRNYWLMLQDIGQISLFRRLSGMGKVVKEAGAPVSFINKTPIRILRDSMGEFAEEAIQYIIEEEADYLTDVSYGFRKENDFGERLSTYANGELLTSGFFGALGAGITQSTSILYNKATGSYQNRQTQKRNRVDQSPISDEERAKHGLDPSKEVEEAIGSPRGSKTNESGDPVSPQTITKNTILNEFYSDALEELEPGSDGHKRALMNISSDLAIKSAMDNNVEETRALLEKTLAADQDDVSETLGINANEMDEGTAQSILHAFDIATEEFNKAQKYGNRAENVSKSKTRARLYNERSAEKMGEVQEIKENIPRIDRLSDVGSQKLDQDLYISGLESAIKQNQETMEHTNGQFASMAHVRLTSLLEEAKKARELMNGEEVDSRTPAQKKSDFEISKGMEPFLDEISEPYGKALVSDQYVDYNLRRASEHIEQAGKAKKIVITDTEMGDFLNDIPAKQPTLQKLANKLDNGGKLEGIESRIYDANAALVEALRKENLNDKLAIDTSGRQAEEGDIVKKNLTGDEVFTYRNDLDENGQERHFIEDSDGHIIEISKQEAESLIVQTTPESKDRRDAESKSKGLADKDDIYPTDKKVTNPLDTRKNTIWSSAWKSANNLQREDVGEDPTEFDEALTSYLEDYQPLENGMYLVPNIDESGLTESEIQEVLDRGDATEIMNIPIKLMFTSFDGTPITYTSSNGTEVQLYTNVHIEKFTKSVQETDGSQLFDTNDPSEILLNQRIKILSAIANNLTVIVPVRSKGAGAVTYDGRVKTSIVDLFKERPMEFAILDNTMVFRNGEQSFLDVPNGNKDMIGRLYAVTPSANGENYVVALERERIDGQEASLIYDLIRYMIGNGNNNAKVEGKIKDKLLANDKNANLLEIYPDMTYEELLNFLIYESEQTIDKDRVFRLDFKERLLYISSTAEDVTSIRFEDIAFQEADITSRLEGHYRNIQIKDPISNTPRLGTEKYDNYLKSSGIVFANIPSTQLFIQPVIYHGVPYIENAPVETNEEDVLTNISSDISIDPVDPNSSTKKVNPKDRPNPFGDPKSDDRIMQKRIFKESPLGNLIPILNNLRIKTGWNYTIYRDVNERTSGYVQGNMIFINSAYASVETLYHEFLHPILRQISKENPRLYNNLVSQLLTTKEGKALYEQVKEERKDLEGEGLIEEVLTQHLGELAADRVKEGRVRNILRNIWNMVLKFFKSIMPSVDVSKISLNSTLADIAKLMTSHSFIGVSNNPMVAYQKADMTRKEFESWSKTLLNAILIRNNVDYLSDVNKIDYSVLVDVVKTIGSNVVTDHQLDLAKEVYYSIVKEDGTINEESPFILHVKDTLRTYGIITDVHDERANDSIDETANRDHIEQYAIGNREKITADIKFLMSFVPMVNSAHTKETSAKVRDSIYERDYQLNETTNLPDYHEFSNIFNTLLIELSGIVENKKPDSNNYEDLYELYLSKIEDIATDRPEFYVLLERLQNEAAKNPSIKLRFVRTLNQSNQNFLTQDTTYSYDKDGNPIANVRHILKNPQSPEKVIIGRWRTNLIKLMVGRRNLKTGEARKGIIEEKMQPIRNRYEHFSKKIDGTLRSSGPISEDIIMEVKRMLDMFGLTMEPREIRKYLKNMVADKSVRNKDVTSLRKGLMKIKSNVQHYINALDDQKKWAITNETEWFIEDEASISDLAKAKGFFRMDLSELNTLGSDNKSRYMYSNWSMMGKVLADYKNDPTRLEKLMAHPFYASSQWGNHILSGKNLVLHIIDNIKTSQNRGKRPKDLVDSERLATTVNAILNGYLPMHARGSNSTEFFISGFDVPSAHAISGHKVILSTEALDILMGYVADEYARIQKEQAYLDTEPELKIDIYHIPDDKTGKVPALQMNLFTALQEGKDKSSLLFDEGGRVTNIDRDQIISDANLRAKINELFRKEVGETRAVFDSHHLIDLTKKQNRAIDSNKFKVYKAKFKEEGISESQQFESAIGAMLYDYVFSGMLANVEQQKIFSGDPALYGSQSNLQKRIQSSGAMGISYYMDPTESEFYNSAVIQDVTLDSKFKKYLKNIGKSTVSDAQAYVTLDLYIDFLNGFGKWKPEYDALVSTIMVSSKDVNEKQLSDFLSALDSSDFSVQPMKTVAAELSIGDNSDLPPRFIFDKQTIIPLIPSFVEGTGLNELLSAMITNEIDHVSYNTATKTGALSPTNILDKEGNFISAEDMKFNKYIQSKRYTFLQQDWTKKGLKEMAEPSQQKYMIMSDIDDNQMYGEYSGKLMKQKLHDTQSTLSNIGVNELQDELFTRGVFDPVKGNDLVLREMTKRTLDVNLAESLSNNFPTEAIPGKNIPIQNMEASIINKAGVKIKHDNGAAYIQTSGLGTVSRLSSLSDAQKKGITYLTLDGLKPPLLENGELQEGEVMISHNILQQYPDIIDNPELIIHLLQGIGSRIPNQSPSNISPLKVVGILPAELGDTMIVYDEMADQMGSDQDGDKVYMIMYNLHPDRPERIRYHDIEGSANNLRVVWEDRLSYGEIPMIEDTRIDKDGIEETFNRPMLGKEFVQRFLGASPLDFNSKQAIQNHKLDLYKQIMSNEESFNRMMSSLENIELVSDAENEANSKKYSLLEKLNPTNPTYQVVQRGIFIDANSAVGVVANHSMDHIKSQGKNQYLINEKGEPYYLGIGTKGFINGKDASILDMEGDHDISKIISAVMTSQVDAESDPRTAMANFNLSTISPIIASVRLGIDIDFIKDVVGNDLVREYVKAKRNSGVVFAPKEGTAVDKAIESYNKAYPNNETLTIEGFDAMPMSMNLGDDYSVLKVFMKLEGIGSELTKSIKGSKFTVDGLGKDLFEMISTIKSLSSQTIGNFESKFFDADGNKTMEQTYYENSVEFMMETFGKNKLITSPAFMGLYDNKATEGGLIEEFAARQGVDLSSPDVIRSIYRGFYSLVMSKPMKADVLSLIGKETSVAMDLDQVRKETSLFLLDLIQEEFFNDFDFISFPNSLNFSTTEMNTLYDDWKRLYKSHPEFTKRLAQYAYASSGFNYTINGMFQTIPSEILDTFGVKDHIEDVIMDSLDETAFSFAMDQIVRHEFDNTDIVPKVYASALDLKATKKLPGARIALKKSDRFDILPEYINYKDKLYLIQNRKEMTYVNVPTLGYNRPGFKAVEYNFDDYSPKSVFEDVPKATPQMSVYRESELSQIPPSKAEPIPQKETSSGMDPSDKNFMVAMRTNGLKNHSPDLNYDKFIENSDFNSLEEFVASRPDNGYAEMHAEIHNIIENC